MKKLPLLLAFVFLLTLNFGFAQIEIEFEDTPVSEEVTETQGEPITIVNRATVTEADESMAKGIQPALVLGLEVADRKLVTKLWKDFMKDYGGKTKRAKGGNGENLTIGAEIVGINGVKPLNIYSKSKDGDDGNSELLVWFDLGEEFLESSRRDQYAEAEKMLLKFAHEVKVEKTRLELKGAEKRLKDMKGDLSRLERQNDGYHNDIEQAEKRIAEAKENIVKNEEQQVDTAQKIELQKQLIDEIARRLAEMRKL